MAKRKFPGFVRNQQRYYRKLVLSHLTVLLLAVSIMAVFNYAFSRDQQNQKMLEVLSYSGQQVATSIEARFDQMRNVSEIVRYTLQQTLSESLYKTPKPQTDADAISAIQTLRDWFQFTDISAWFPPDYFSAHEGITFFDISAPEGRAQRPEVLQAPYNKLSWMMLSDYRYPFMRFSSYKSYNLITCFTRVSMLSESSAFCFFIDMDEREIAALLDKSESTPVEQYMIDAQGRILSHPDSAMLGQSLAPELVEALNTGDAQHPVFYDGTTYLTYPLGTTEWRLLVSVPESYLTAISLTSANGLLIAVAIATGAAVFVSLLISRQLMRKLLMMSNVIKSIEPNFQPGDENARMITVKMPVARRSKQPDVLDDLALVFNKLVDRLNASMQSALNNSLSQEKLRYQLLRAKINPHFLYNMLDSIKICNTLGRTDDANRMLSKLAAFYRLILRKNDLDIITIGEELEIVRLYLEMEVISHEHSFTYTVETDPDVELFSIPRFVLQPLVENCVTHGLPGDAKHMTIAISLRYVDNAIHIEIRDDGLGMDEAMMERMMRVVHGEADPGRANGGTAFYGLSNVSARLRSYVVEASESIRYTSRLGEGTTVEIDLKQLLMDEPETSTRKEAEDVQGDSGGR